MKDLVARYAERIDNGTLRERVMIFAAAALVLVVALNSALIAPLRTKQQRLGGEIAQKEKELRIVQIELQRLARVRDADPDVRNRARSAELRTQLAELDGQIAAERRRFTSPQRMRAVLEEMLERDKRLQLLDLKTLPVKELTVAQAQGGAQRVYRHGVEVTVAGRYLDIYAYLKSLEGTPSQLYWGRAEMSVADYPVSTLKVTVYTLSFDQAWLVV